MTYRSRIPQIERGITRYKPPKSEIEKLAESHFEEFPDIPFNLPAEEAKQYGFELPENYQLEARQEAGGLKYYQVPTEEFRLEIESAQAEYKAWQDALSASGWGVTDTGLLQSPEGLLYTTEELEAKQQEDIKQFEVKTLPYLPEDLQAKYQTLPLENFWTEYEAWAIPEEQKQQEFIDTIAAVFPDVAEGGQETVNDWIAKLNTDAGQEDILARLTAKGRSPETERLLTAIGATPEQIDELFQYVAGLAYEPTPEFTRQQIEEYNASLAYEPSAGVVERVNLIKIGGKEVDPKQFEGIINVPYPIVENPEQARANTAAFQEYRRQGGELSADQWRKVGAALVNPQLSNEDLASVMTTGLTAEEKRQKRAILYGERTTLAQLSGGMGDIAMAAAGVSSRLGYTDLQQSLVEQAKEFQYGVPEPKNTAESLVRTLPFMAALAPAAIIGGVAVAPLAGAVGGAISSPFWAMVASSAITGAGAAGLSRPIEAAFEAGGTLNESIARGDTPEQAADAFDKTFKGNMALVGMDAAEFGLAFAKVPSPLRKYLKPIISTAGKVIGVGLTEGAEEIVQDIIQRKALGQDVDFDPQMKQAMLLGFIMGAGMGGIGDVYTAISNRTLETIPANMTAQFDKVKSDALGQGLNEQQAGQAALDWLAQQPRGKEIIAQATKWVEGQVQEVAIAESVKAVQAGRMELTPEVNAPLPKNPAVVGKQIAQEFGVKYDGVQTGIGMQFTDPQTGSTTYGNTADEVRTNLENMRAKFEQPAIPKAETGMPEAGVQAGAFGVPAKEVRPQGKGRITQISMDEQLKLEQMRREQEISGLKEYLQSEPASALTNLTKKLGWYEGEVSNLTLKQYRDLTGKREILPNILTKDKKHVRWEYALDEIATEYGYPDGDALKEAIEQSRETELQIKSLTEEPIGLEVFPGITEVKELLPLTAEEVAPPAVPPVQPPQTVEVPKPPPSPDARNRIIKQSQEIVKQSMPGALNRLFQKIPGIKQAMQYERPALIAYAEGNPHLVVAQVAEVAASSDVQARAVATRIPLFKTLHDAFGELALRGEKTDIEFVGTPEQAKNSITGTLFDIAQNPELYKLSQKQLSALKSINEHNDRMLDYVVNKYGAEIGKFEPKKNGAFLSNIDVDENIIEYLGSESRAIARGRGKTRFWQTGRDRMESDKTFVPELDVKKIIEGMDSFKASAAAGVTFREIVGGKTRLEVIQETHPELYNRMESLRRQLQKLQSYKRILTEQQLMAIDDFLSSPHEEADIVALDDAFFLQAGRYVAKARAGEMLLTLNEQIQGVKDQIRELKPAWNTANLKPYVFVQEGLYRYFTPAEAKYIVQSRKTTSNPVLAFIEKWRGQAFSGDLSPFAIQGSLGVLADPIGSLKATAGGIKAGVHSKDFMHSISIDGLIDDMNSDIEGWSEFASLMGRTITGTPKEYAAGFLSTLKGFDKFTETTYITVTRGTKNLWDRTWQGLVKNGVPELEAKVAAIEVASKVYPLVNPAKLGQSQARASVLRAMPTSYSFIRQPATLIAQASMGYAKLITFQKMTPQERIAVRTITTMAASTLATSMISAIASAMAHGKDDDEILQAALDAINPDPYNGKFASIIIGEFRIPLGGPYRSIFRAIYPQEVKGISYPVPFAGIPKFIVNRITPAIKTQINLMLNKDYYGKQIVKGEFPENIIRGLLYELEGALPLSLGELMGGIRREEGWDEILQQSAAQFVGVNLMKLDNTYFHKLVRNLGLPTMETPSLYSADIPNFTTNNLYSKVVPVLSDVTLDEIEQRKGYPSLIQIIIEARDLKKEIWLLPSHSPVSLNADPARNNGITYKELYQQWQDRQELVDAGDDAEYTAQPELVGGEYKYKTYKGDDAVKAFDRDNPQAEQGNMTRRQFALLEEYWSITDPIEQKDFLSEHPEIATNPRQDYLKKHPKENAQLAVWGQADILTRAAYDEFKRLLVEYDIPDSAIPELTLPPEGSIDTHFKYLDMVAEGTYNSVEAKLLLAQDDVYRQWKGLAPVTTPIEALEIRVKNRALTAEYEALETDEERQQFKLDNPAWVDDSRKVEAIENNGSDYKDKWVERGKIVDEFGASSTKAKLWLVDNQEVWRWALDVGLLTDAGTDWNETILRLNDKLAEQDAEYNVLPVGDGSRETYLLENEEYRLDRRRREAYQKEIPDNLIDSYVEYYELPVTGYRRERMLIENPALADAMGLNIPDKVPSVKYDELLEKPDKTEADLVMMQGYKLYVPDNYINRYADWTLLNRQEKPNELPVWYEDDWYLIEHPAFYEDIYLGLFGLQERDFSKVPTREVFDKYAEYALLTTNKAREDYRANNLDLDAWGQTAFGWTPITEKRRKAGLSPQERAWESTEAAERAITR